MIVDNRENIQRALTVIALAHDWLAMSVDDAMFSKPISNLVSMLHGHESKHLSTKLCQKTLVRKSSLQESLKSK